MKKIKWIAVVLCALTLAACGSMPSSDAPSTDKMDHNFSLYGR